MCTIRPERLCFIFKVYYLPCTLCLLICLAPSTPIASHMSCSFVMYLHLALWTSLFWTFVLYLWTVCEMCFTFHSCTIAFHLGLAPSNTILMWCKSSANSHCFLLLHQKLVALTLIVALAQTSLSCIWCDLMSHVICSLSFGPCNLNLVDDGLAIHLHCACACNYHKYSLFLLISANSVVELVVWHC